MFDTLHFKIPVNNLGMGINDFTEQLTDLLCNANNKFDSQTGELIYMGGNLSNLKIMLSQWCLKIKGSLCKYYLGDNFQTLKYSDVRLAEERLSDELHVNVSKADITRLDFGTNLIMDNPTEVYFNHLGELRYFERVQFKSGVRYQTFNKTLCLYDKNKEAKQHKEVIPDSYKGCNTLRYEVRFMHKVADQLKLNEVIGATLYDRDVYNLLFKEWQNAFSKITPINETQTDFINKDSMKLRNLRLLGMLPRIEKAGGKLQFIQQVNEAYKRGDITRRQADTRKKNCRDACGLNNDFMVECKMYAELKNKVLSTTLLL